MLSVLSFTEGEFILTGSERLQQRPIKSLVDALRQLDADIEYLNEYGYPPVRVRGKKLAWGKIRVNPGISSQVVTSLMLVAPFIHNGLEIELQAEPVSWPYIVMTAELLKYFGVVVEISKQNIKIPSSKLSLRQLIIEPDWSSAAFLYLWAGLWPGREIHITGIPSHSWQGDAVLINIGQEFGIKSSFTNTGLTITKLHEPRIKEFVFGFKDYPDLVPPIATLCVLLKIPFTMTGLKTLRIKESDRIEALGNEFSALGAKVEAGTDYLKCSSFGELPDEPIKIHTYNDHRITMSFAMAATRFPQLLIEDPDNVSKSFPAFWQQIENLGFKIAYYEQ